MVKRTADMASLLDTAAAVHRAGDLARAWTLYSEVLKHDPDNADALHLLGVIASQQGKYDDALDLIGRAISRQGRTAAFHASLGRVFRQLGRAREAEACFRDALRLDPGLFEVMLRLGNIRRERGELSDAETCYRNALARKPDYAEAHANLGVVLKARGQLDQAISHYRTALQHRPDLAPIHCNLGNALRAQARTLEAIASYREAVRLDPEYGDAHLNLALALLLAGEFEEGWREYEWRWKCDAARKVNVLRGGFVQPLWDGTDPAGRRILLQAEQGYGDAIQFVRFTDAIARRGATVIVECQPELKRLLASAAGVAQVVARDEPLPDFDLHCPLISVARILGIGLETMRATVPYLSCGATRSADWSERLGGAHGTLRVGLAWAGAQENSNDRNRSISLAALSPLAAAHNVAFYSLQKGPAGLQAASPPAAMRLHDHALQLQDFADTGALIERLDLVISVDTAVAHLAGALGKPAWTLLEFSPDWRWMLGRDTTPWYPSMRLFRQAYAGDWNGTIERVAEALKQRAANAPRQR